MLQDTVHLIVHLAQLVMSYSVFLNIFQNIRPSIANGFPDLHVRQAFSLLSVGSQC